MDAAACFARQGLGLVGPHVGRFSHGARVLALLALLVRTGAGAPGSSQQPLELIVRSQAKTHLQRPEIGARGSSKAGCQRHARC